jgi:hypothetical protein
VPFRPFRTRRIGCTPDPGSPDQPLLQFILMIRSIRRFLRSPARRPPWTVHGSLDRRWGVGADFAHNIYLIDRTNDELIPHSTSHRPSEQDHPHPTFSPDGTKIQIQPRCSPRTGGP